MPQNTNLNVIPYNDDFEEDKNYHRVLFKPGTAIQARELTTLQTILQNQIEKFGSYVFKEGAKVIPGQTGLDFKYNSVQIDATFFGISVNSYTNKLINKTIVGETSGVKALVVNTLTDQESERGNNTLYIRYLSSSNTDFETSKFIDGERLLVEEDLEYGLSVIKSGNPFATCISENSTSLGSAAFIEEGIYFIRGFFAKVLSQTLILDQYNNLPSYRIGLLISEEIVTSFDDSTLNDNSQGFSNFAAPGADRFKLSTTLIKKPLDQFNDEDFIELMRVENGATADFVNTSNLNLLQDELARRTYDESGDYYIKPFEIFARESLNDRVSNSGIYFENQKTAQGNTPSEDLFTLQISPGKAYVKGYEIEKPSSTFLDIRKPETSNTVDTYSLPINFGNRMTLDNVSGSPIVGFGTTTFLSLRSQRIGANKLVAPGEEIGRARCYDFKLKDAAYANQTSKFEAFLYDIDTFTKVSIASSITLSVPALIEGNSSGSKGYLTASIVNSNILTLNSGSGTFIVGESISVNGISSSPTISSVTDSTLFDIKSLYSSVGVTTFSGDLDLSIQDDISDLPLTISAASAGVCTITGLITRKIGASLFVNDILAYTRSGFSTITYNRVTSIGQNLNTVTIVGVTTVSDVCDGGLPSTETLSGGIRVVLPELEDSDKASFFQAMPHSNISNINLDNTQLVFRKTYPIVVSSSGAVIIESDVDSVFEPFDEERYLVTYSNGTVEPLSRGKLIFSQDAKTIILSQLSVSADANARFTGTLRKIKVNAKSKVLTRCAKLTINKSNNPASGSTGNTSLNDGLTYGSIYGTRVQDREISLNKAEVLRIHAIFESDDNNIPTIPTLILSNIVGNLLEVPSGDEFIGESSGAAGRVVSSTSTTLEFVYQNEREFQLNERFTCKLSQVSATITNINPGDKKINANFSLDSGERLEYLDFGRIIRKSEFSAPSRQITVIFDFYSTPTADDGEFFCYLSWPPRVVNDSIDLPRIDYDTLRHSDVIDLRPRVSDYNINSGFAPFEFVSRIFPNDGSSVTANVVIDESLVLGYSYRLPRIDKIILTKNGFFESVSGEPAENPVAPILTSDAFEVATVTIPPYSYNSQSDLIISFTKHKRYQMKDISVLENRIKNIEYYTQLSLLELDTQTLSIKDPVTGLDRFKNGIFIDNFTSHGAHNLASPDFKASIDAEDGNMRPSHYTTSLDLLLGSASAIGIGTTANVAADLRFVTDLGNANIQRTGDLISLKYTEIPLIEQRFASGVVNVNPFAVITWISNIVLNPETDTWIEESMLEPQRVEERGNYDAFLTLYQADPNTGLSPIDWKAWQTVWTGKTVKPGGKPQKGTVVTNTIIQNSYISGGGRHSRRSRTTTFRDTSVETYLAEYDVKQQQNRAGIQYKITPRIDITEIEAKFVSREVIPYCRERNIEFIAKSVKPSTQMYVFFENVDMTQYCIPKLLEVTMNSGVFLGGEKIKSLTTTVNTSASFEQFTARLAVANHKYGPYNAPTTEYLLNPYNTLQEMSLGYSATSTILNIDTASLSDMATGAFKGRVRVGTRLKGETSGAEATVNNLRLISDTSATLIGSLYIPNPKFVTNPQFTSGIKNFRLTNSSTNSTISGTVESAGEHKFTSSGILSIKQGSIISTRNADVQTLNLSESRIVNGVEQGVATKTTLNFRVEREWIDPLAESVLIPKGEDCFVTSIDVFFQSKDLAIPVTCQIRTMIAGYPTTTIVPMAEVTLEPSQVNVSSNGTAATKFTFRSPIFLQGGTEYAIVLLSMSNSYNAWISQMGKVDISTVGLGVDRQVVISQQPYMGSLFKSQNGSTWDASQYEDLKFVMHRAQFVTDAGVFTAYNPVLTEGNGNIVTLRPNPIFTPSNEIVVGLGSTVPSTFLNAGVTITQINNTNATAKLVKTSGIIGIGSITISTPNLTVNNVGSGITPSTGNFYYENVSLNAVTGNGSGGLALVEVIAGNIGIVTVTNGGGGYSVGDVVSAQLGATSQNVRFNVGVITSINQLVLNQVQGTFNTLDNLAFNNVGVASTLPAIPTTISSSGTGDGQHMIISHRNHGMHSASNQVIISSLDSDYPATTLSAEYSNTSTTNIPLTSISILTNFENVGVSSTNPGYIVINDEIISYQGVSGNSLTGITRAIDNTLVKTHSVNSSVNKYEFNGISLRRINKTHNLSSATISDPISLDTYAIKIDRASNGVDRSTGNSGGFQPLSFNITKSGGGFVAKATQNIQFEALTPNIARLTPEGTFLVARARTTTGTSVNGTEVSFTDYGFNPITLDDINYYEQPMIIASQVNETARLSTLPGNKSFALECVFNTDNDRLSPIIDLQRLNIITTSNRIDKPISNYVTDRRVNVSLGDPHAAVYVSKRVSLATPASSLQVRFDAFRDSTNEIRVFYRLFRSDLPDADQTYSPFPGYDNLRKSGSTDNTAYTIIDLANNSGLPNDDVKASVPGGEGEFLEYLYSQDNLPPFSGFMIKIVMNGTNQAFVPKIRDLRAIALA